jgi:myosin heavy subunit
MKAALTFGTAITQGYQGVLSVQALLGVKSEALLEILTKIQATQGILNSLNAVRNALDKDSILVLKAKTMGQKLYNWVLKGTATATNGAATATKGLNVAMRALPILAIIGGLTALVSWLIKTKDKTDDLTDSTKELTEAEKAYNEARSQRLTQQRDIDDLVRISNKLSQEQLKSLKSRLEQEIALSEKNEGEIKLSKERIQLTKDNIKQYETRLKQINDELNSEKLLDNVKRQKLLFEKDLLSGKITQENEVIRLQKQGLNLTDDELSNLNKRREQLAAITNLIKQETKAVKDNAKAKKQVEADLSILEDETKDIQKEEDERLKIQEEALERLSLKRRLENIKRFDDQEKFNQAELENEIDLINNLIKLRQDYGKDTLDLEVQRAELLQQFRAKELQDSKDSILTTVDDIASAITDIYNQAADNAINAFRRQEDAAARMYGTFEKLAVEGNITAQQSMAEMQERIEEQQRRQMQMEQRKLRMQQAQQVSSILLNQLEQGKTPGEALEAAGAFLATSKTLLASLPSFKEGTEMTTAGNLDKDGGHLAILHKGERVMTEQQNKMVGNLSNPMVADIAYKYRTGQLSDSAGNSYDLIELKHELQGIKSAIQNQPHQVVGLEETLSGMVEMMVKNIKGNHTRTTIYKS